MNIKRLLFPTDLSDCSLAALNYASDLAASWTAELHVLYVNDLRDLVGMAAYANPTFVASSARIELKEQLEAIKPALVCAPCHYHYSEGVPADEICTLAENENIDLIVMSSHGRTGLSRVLVGSVAEKVLRAAKCPVLIVKQPGNAEANVVTEPGQTKAVTGETSAGFKKL